MLSHTKIQSRTTGIWVWPSLGLWSAQSTAVEIQFWLPNCCYLGYVAVLKWQMTVSQLLPFWCLEPHLQFPKHLQGPGNHEHVWAYGVRLCPGQGAGLASGEETAEWRWINWGKEGGSEQDVQTAWGGKDSAPSRPVPRRVRRWDGHDAIRQEGQVPGVLQEVAPPPLNVLETTLLSVDLWIHANQTQLLVCYLITPSLVPFWHLPDLCSAVAGETGLHRVPLWRFSPGSDSLWSWVGWLTFLCLCFLLCIYRNNDTTPSQSFVRKWHTTNMSRAHPP